MLRPAFHVRAMHPADMRILDTLVHDHHQTAAPRLHATAQGHVVTLAAPGLAPNDVKVEVCDGRLTIAGENKRKRVDISIQLPRDADVDGVTAEVADGLITVNLKRCKPTSTHVAIDSVSADDESSDKETDDEAHTLSLVAAGFSAADLALSMEDGVLTLSGQSKRTGALLERRARLPRDVDVDKVSATHVDGILTVHMPTKPAAEPRRIAVNATAEVETAPAEAEAETSASDKDEAVPAAAEVKEAEAADEDAVMV